MEAHSAIQHTREEKRINNKQKKKKKKIAIQGTIIKYLLSKINSVKPGEPIQLKRNARHKSNRFANKFQRKKKKKSPEALYGHHMRATWPTCHNTLRSTVHTTLKDWHMRREDGRDGACRWWWWIRKCLKVVELMDATSNAHIKYELEKRGTFILLGAKTQRKQKLCKKVAVEACPPSSAAIDFSYMEQIVCADDK